MGSGMLDIDGRTGVPLSELTFRFSRSAGPGGQHVNKVSTRVELLFDVARSPSLDDAQKHRIVAALGSRISEDGVLRVSTQETRSQWSNRELVVEKFVLMLRKALSRQKRRVPTGPSAASKAEKAQAKKLHSRKKSLRRRIQAEDTSR